VATTWLKAEGQNRAWRTLLHGMVATVLVPAIDAAIQVLVRALSAGGTFNWGQVAASAGVAAMTAGLMAYTAYLHRTVLDPSSFPSALPPRPPGATATEAPLTEPPQTQPRTEAFRSRWPDEPEKGD
jgi:hypothetical protein